MRSGSRYSSRMRCASLMACVQFACRPSVASRCDRRRLRGNELAAVGQGDRIVEQPFPAAISRVTLRPDSS